MPPPIVVGTDFSETAAAATEAAVALGRTLGSPVVLVHAYQPVNAYLLDERVIASYLDALRLASEQAMREEKARWRDRGVELRALVTFGMPDAAVVDTARREAAELVVVGTAGRRGAVRYLLGSTAEGVVRTSPVPIVVVRTRAGGILDWAAGARPARVLLATDLEEGFPAIARFARRLATAKPVEMDVVHAFELGAPGAAFERPPRSDLEASTRAAMRQAVDREALPVDVSRCWLEAGKPAEAIVSLAERLKSDLIVVGTHGRKGVDRLIAGSVATGVLRRSRIPVAVVPIE